MSFEGKTVVVTGGTGALGRAICSRFLAEGAIVHTSYFDEAELDDLPGPMRNIEVCHHHRVDLRDEAEVINWFDQIDSLDILVNAAGGFAMSDVLDTSLEAWSGMLTMNLQTCFLCCREGLSRMSDKPYGRIVNVGAFAATKAPAGMGLYTVSKAGVAHLTEVLAEETLPLPITVNAVLPTIMDTPANREAMPDADRSAWVPVVNVAETIRYLCTVDAWHVTGALIPVRGKM